MRTVSFFFSSFSAALAVLARNSGTTPPTANRLAPPTVVFRKSRRVDMGTSCLVFGVLYFVFGVPSCASPVAVGGETQNTEHQTRNTPQVSSTGTPAGTSSRGRPRGHGP